LHSKSVCKAIAFRLIRKLAIHKINANNISITIAEDKRPKKEQEEEERYSCWCFLLVDGTKFEAKIAHKGRGKFKILNDEYGGKYNNKVVDASDVIRCKIEI
jgi:hypothetical protein